MLKRSTMFSTLVRRLQTEVTPAHARLIPIFSRDMSAGFNLAVSIEASDLGNPFGKFFEDAIALNDRLSIEISKKTSVDTISMADKVLLEIAKGPALDSIAVSDSVITAFTDGPTAMSLDGWWRDYPASLPWTGVASAGGSGSRSLSVVGDTPTQGTAQNGHIPIRLDSTTDTLGQVLNSDIVTTVSNTATAYSGWVLVKLGTLGGGIFGFENVNTGYGVTVNGTSGGNPIIRIFHYDLAAASDKSLNITTALPFNTYGLIQWRYGSNTLQGRLNGSSWVSLGSVGAAYHPIGSFYSRIGTTKGVTSSNTSEILELGLSKQTLTDTQFNAILNYCRTRYNLAL